jgi:hypothetical protein
LGRGAFVLSSGTAFFELSCGVSYEEARDGGLLNSQFGSDLTLRRASAPHAKGNTDLAFDELFTGHVYV